MKSEVLAAIGEESLRRPAAVNAARAANDRVKYALALLQMAAAHAETPDQPVADLKHERIACGIADRRLDSLLKTARREGSCYQMPGARRLLERIAGDLREMATPIVEAGREGFSARLGWKEEDWRNGSLAR